MWEFVPMMAESSEGYTPKGNIMPEQEYYRALKNAKHMLKLAFR